MYRFVLKLDELLARARAATSPLHIVVVGGGAGGVEVALSMQVRYSGTDVQKGTCTNLSSCTPYACSNTLRLEGWWQGAISAGEPGMSDIKT